MLFVLASASSLAQNAAKKTPVPADAAQAEAMKLVKEVYGDEYPKAETSREKQDLAKKLLGKARETADDPTGKFVLLKLARDIASQANDAQTAFQAIDEMADNFQVDVLETKSIVLTKFASAARHSLKPTQHISIAEEALKLVDQAVSQDNFTVADQLGKLALDEARKTSEKELVSKVQGQIAAASETAKAYEDVKAARVKLEKTPDDHESNLVVGKYLCFVKGDWEKGLAMLALGKDEALKALATQELQGAASSTEQAKLGDGWWNLAEKQEGKTKKQIQARAGYWYQKALPGLSGLIKDKAEKRTKASVITNNGPEEDRTTKTYLDDLKEIKSSVVVGEAGVGKHGATAYQDRNLIQKFAFRGQIPSHALFMGPPSNGKSWATYGLRGKFLVFSATAAIGSPPDGASAKAEWKHGWRGMAFSPITFRVLGDGKLLWESTSIQKSGDGQNFKVTVRGVYTLDLEVDCPGNGGAAWAAWIDPCLKK